MLIQIVAEIETYFINNWTSTPIHIDGLSFDNAGIQEYIFVRYVNTENESLMGLNTAKGTLQVYCYHKIKNQSIILSDDVKSFIDGKDLPHRIFINCGVQTLTHKLDNGFWLSLLHFEVSQN